MQTQISALPQAMEFVLGNTKEVSAFDKSRQRHKRRPKDKECFGEYMTNLAIIEVKLSCRMREIRGQLRQWEREFFVKNGKTAIPEDIQSCPDTKLMVDQIKHGKALLNKFKPK